MVVGSCMVDRVDMLVLVLGMLGMVDRVDMVRVEGTVSVEVSVELVLAQQV